MRDKLLPLVAHTEGGMRERAEVAGISLGRNDFVADVEQRIHQPAVGVVDENESLSFHFCLFINNKKPSDIAGLFSTN